MEDIGIGGDLYKLEDNANNIVGYAHVFTTGSIAKSKFNVTSLNIIAIGGGGGAGGTTKLCGGGGCGAYAYTTSSLDHNDEINILVGPGGNVGANGGITSVSINSMNNCAAGGGGSGGNNSINGSNSVMSSNYKLFKRGGGGGSGNSGFNGGGLDLTGNSTNGQLGGSKVAGSGSTSLYSDKGISILTDYTIYNNGMIFTDLRNLCFGGSSSQHTTYGSGGYYSNNQGSGYNGIVVIYYLISNITYPPGIYFYNSLFDASENLDPLYKSSYQCSSKFVIPLNSEDAKLYLDGGLSSGVYTIFNMYNNWKLIDTNNLGVNIDNTVYLNGDTSVFNSKYYYRLYPLNIPIPGRFILASESKQGLYFYDSVNTAINDGVPLYTRMGTDPSGNYLIPTDSSGAELYDSSGNYTIFNTYHTWVLSNTNNSTDPLSAYYYNGSNLPSIYYYTFYPYKHIPICFLEGTPVCTDQGEIAIETIDPAVNTINGKRIIAITKTSGTKGCLILLKKDIISPNIPSRDTYITGWHKVYHGNRMRESKRIPGNIRVQYNDQPLYNVLMETHEKMIVNGLTVETLLPTHQVAKYYLYNLSKI